MKKPLQQKHISTSLNRIIATFILGIIFTASGARPWTYDFGTGTGRANNFNAVSSRSNVDFIYPYNLEFSNALTDCPTITVTATPGTISCNGGTTTVTVSATGGTAPYTGEGTFTTEGAGPHTYTVTDNNGCTGSITINIAEPDAIVVTAIPGAISCNAGTTSVSVSATGGSGTYVSGTGIITGEAAGSHTYTVTDNNGCTGSITINITEPDAIVVTATPLLSNLVCHGNTTTVTVSATGGSGIYTSGTGTFTDSAGTFIYTVIDNNGCTGSATITITEPVKTVITNITKANVSCNGANDGSIAVTVTGGTPPYQYSFDNGVTYQPGNTITGLTPGTYNLAIKDANDCVKEQFRQDKIIITEPAVLGANICYTTATKTLHVVGTGGTIPYKYSKDGITYNNKNTLDGGRDYIIKSTTYIIYVKDKKGCSYTQTGTTASLPACTSTLIANSGNESSIVAKTSLISLNVKVLPNPSENYFTLTMSGIKNEPVQIKVVDMFGKVLFTAHGNANDTYRFGDQFASGAYMVEIMQATEKKTIKVVKR